MTTSKPFTIKCDNCGGWGWEDGYRQTREEECEECLVECHCCEGVGTFPLISSFNEACNELPPGMILSGSYCYHGNQYNCVFLVLAATCVGHERFSLTLKDIDSNDIYEDVLVGQCPEQKWECLEVVRLQHATRQ